LAGLEVNFDVAACLLGSANLPAAAPATLHAACDTITSCLAKFLESAGVTPRERRRLVRRAVQDILRVSYANRGGVSVVCRPIRQCLRKVNFLCLPDVDTLR